MCLEVSSMEKRVLQGFLAWSGQIKVKLIGWLPLLDMAFYSALTQKRCVRPLHSIRSWFPHKISGEFCTLLSCSENMTDGVFEKKKGKQNTKYFLNKTFIFFYQTPLVCLCFFLYLGVVKAAVQSTLALPTPAGLCCVIVIITFWLWAKSMQPDWRPLTVDSRNWFNISRRGLAHIDCCSNFIFSLLLSVGWHWRVCRRKY